MSPDPVVAAVAAFQPDLPLAVALSGGADSATLLTLCARRWPGQVRAVHVHHGLQTAANAFVTHCESLCRELDVPLAVLRVDARPAGGDSPEDAARRARYRALADYAQTTEFIPSGGLPIRSLALAQHADDQVETLLLALSRGAGLAGLAAMPARWRRGGVDYHRPLLGVSGQAVRACASAEGVRWIEDPSNGDERFTRNRIRARLMPALEACFPQFRTTFARSASHAAQAQEVLHDLAGADLAQVGIPPRIQALQALDPARQALVLRHWLRSQHGTTPEAAQLAELQRQIRACTTRGHQLRLKVGAGHVLREGERLAWYNFAVLPAAKQTRLRTSKDVGPLDP